MKIGQLTFHGSHNYGSVLQAYALSRQLQLMGHDTEIINLRPKAQKDAYRVIMGSGAHRAFHYLIYPQLKRRYDQYERFITQVLPITEKEYSSTEELKKENFGYDAFVCGGDQIWNPVCQDFESAYYLQFLGEDNRARKISYAPSLGKTQFDSNQLEKIKGWLNKFDRISVREECGAELLRKLTEKPVKAVCDPVVLLERNEWERLAKRKNHRRPYILVYFLENNHGSRGLTKWLQKQTGFDVVLLNEYIRDFFTPYHKNYGASPEEFVGLFMDASLVYTNSFHGTAFATIFEKPLITAIAANQETVQNNNDSRKIDYLYRLGMEDCLYREGTPKISEILKYDYEEPRKRISQYRTESLAFLRDSLEKSI